MSNKYSSFKNHQLITENWRAFVNEEEALEEDQLDEEDELDEGWIDRMVARGKGGMTSLGGKLKGAAQSGVGKLAGAVGSPEAAEKLSTQATDTKAAAAQRGQAKKALHILKTSYKEFATDVRQLGLEDPAIDAAIGQLVDAIADLEARAR
jgi:hypothetical protein